MFELVGLTGGIATGKSTASEYLKKQVALEIARAIPASLLSFDAGAHSY